MPDIKLIDSTQTLVNEIHQHTGESVGAALKRNGYQLSFPCGGRGTCGNCRYRAVKGAPRPSAQEERLLSKEELERGERLLCCSSFLTDGTIWLPEGEDGIASPLAARAKASGTQRRSGALPDSAACDVAADIGTTTIALALRERQSGGTVSTVLLNNSQRSFGADVLSRIEAANAGHGKELQRLVWQDIFRGIQSLLEQSGYKSGQLGTLVISANTTMEHLLAGDSCRTLGEAPFTPVSLELRRRMCRELFAETPQEYAGLEAVLLPGISAFVGADIVSGMYECRMGQSRKPVLLLDLGTNGEMALGSRDGFLAASTAAGPALEGAGISCGVAGVTGAISSISVLGSRLVAHTIGNQKPIGLCGTGVLELAYELRKLGLVDENGTLAERFRETGYPVSASRDGSQILFTQQDMRQLQMAKSAIRSGIEILTKEMGLSPAEIDKVYLAGGLGYKLNVYKAAGIGLIPQALREKTTAVGNSSLTGALKYLAEEDSGELEHLRRKTKEMNLAAHPQFETNYYRYMNF